MDGLSLVARYGSFFDELSRVSRAASVIDETNVYQEANPATRKVMDFMVGENLLPGSRIEGRAHFQDFLSQIKSGKRGLILMEHYSNMDLPELCYLLDHDEGEFGPELARRLVAMAGMKLNESQLLVKAWAEGFTRIVIYPSRSLSAVPDAEEEARARKINMAAMRALDAAKRNGQAVLVFPSGTRYRPGKPETKRGVREIDSYLRMFDIMTLVSVNGSCLRINPEKPNDMLEDQVFADKLILSASPVIECKTFRNTILEAVKDKPDVDPKQATVDRIMELLESQHIEYEKLRQG